MAMFDYKNYSSQQAAELLSTAYKIASFDNTVGFAGLLSMPVLQPALDIINSTGLAPNHIEIGLPDGWRAITPSELGLPNSALDSTGHYTFQSPILGNVPLGPQATIAGQYDAQGHLVKVALSWTGTNSLTDLPDYFFLNNGGVVPHMEPLLNAVKNFVLQNNLAAEDVLITGYSLGGALANLNARYRDTLAGGFFQNADFVAIEPALIFDDPSILNYGYENDVVHRVVGNGTILDALQNAGLTLGNPDTDYGSSIDNLVLFDDLYASPLWPLPVFSLINPVSWSSHIGGVMTDAYQRIIDNPFYEYMQRDSNVVVANLTSIGRGLYWVEDKASPTSSHFGESAFIIGSAYDDKIKGGNSSDYLYGGHGNDTFKAGQGADRIDGGSGQDELVLNGSRYDWNAYRLSDGTVFFDNKTNSDLIQTEHVEKVSFEGDWLSPSPYNITSTSLSKGGLFGQQSIAYKSATQGNDNDNTLSGSAVFGMDGDDVLSALAIGSLLHGGTGDDTLIGLSGNDQLYGAEGHDVFYASKGNDVLFGGVGNDSFVFNQKNTGKTTIKDFNHFDGDNDTLSFSSSVFASKSALTSATHQVGDDVIIYAASYSIVLEDTSINTVLSHASII